LHHHAILLPFDASIFLGFAIIEYWLPILINFMVLGRNLIAVIVGSFCDDQRRMSYVISKSEKECQYVIGLGIIYFFCILQRDGEFSKCIRTGADEREIF
jgi:hypothetical protein